MLQTDNKQKNGEIYEFWQYKKEEKITGVIVMYDTGGASFMMGCGSKADENGSAQVSAEEKNVTEIQGQGEETATEQIMTEVTETAQTKTQETEQTEETEPAELAPTETRETEEIITTEVIKGEADSSRRVHHHRLRTQSSLLRLEIPRLAQSSLLRWKTRRQIQPRQTFPVISL